ncbi:peroxiredoxin-like family protein [Euzebyella saccharophila]|uniref:Peroxiredoxin-like family protein n=1 Tax=Euzebyella saccharophila TaxID=679664 RepID=A0ABV8JQT5_9FLAO|nr:peroxiredoxin-like family protein [Euzebyella saccharophila]
MLIPRKEVPQIELNLINGTRWSLQAQESESFTMMVFYRGIHCPVCKKQLEELAGKLDEFSKRGVNVVAISSNTEELAKKTAEKWDIPELPLAYGLTISQAREWGLYVSNGISDKEPDQFTEPGLFFVKPDNTLYAASIQTMPFARPGFDDILNMVDYVTKNDYPARGEAEVAMITEMA